MVFCVRNAIFIFVFLNNFVTFLTSFPLYVNVVNLSFSWVSVCVSCFAFRVGCLFVCVITVIV
jgi:hypothetical protein